MTTTEPTQPPKDWGVLKHFLVPVEAALPALLDQIRARVERYPDLPHCWAIGNGKVDPVHGIPMSNLQFGVAAAEGTGVLSWWDDDDRQFRPVVGVNVEDVEYRMAGVHTTYFDAGTVVPVEVVYAAVGEYLRTHERPACLEWVAVDGV